MDLNLITTEVSKQLKNCLYCSCKTGQILVVGAYSRSCWRKNRQVFQYGNRRRLL